MVFGESSVVVERALGVGEDGARGLVWCADGLAAAWAGRPRGDACNLVKEVSAIFEKAPTNLVEKPGGRRCQHTRRTFSGTRHRASSPCRCAQAAYGTSTIPSRTPFTQAGCAAIWSAGVVSTDPQGQHCEQVWLADQPDQREDELSSRARLRGLFWHACPGRCGWYRPSHRLDGLLRDGRGVAPPRWRPDGVLSSLSDPCLSRQSGCTRCGDWARWFHRKLHLSPSPLWRSLPWTLRQPRPLPPQETLSFSSALPLSFLLTRGRVAQHGCVLGTPGRSRGMKFLELSGGALPGVGTWEG